MKQKTSRFFRNLTKYFGVFLTIPSGAIRLERMQIMKNILRVLVYLIYALNQFGINGKVKIDLGKAECKVFSNLTFVLK